LSGKVVAAEKRSEEVIAEAVEAEIPEATEIASDVGRMITLVWSLGRRWSLERCHRCFCLAWDCYDEGPSSFLDKDSELKTISKL
jgi:hypothetical protein